MTSIASIVNNHLTQKCGVAYQIINDAFVETSADSVICRHDPSPAVEKRFIDGSRQGAQVLAYYARFKNARSARAVLSRIIESLDATTIVDGDTVIECEAQSMPMYVMSDEKGYTLYTATVRAEYTQNKE